jgi:hypothetical protein
MFHPSHSEACRGSSIQSKPHRIPQ